jgi:uncharacterized phage protein gp47/JayE
MVATTPGTRLNPSVCDIPGSDLNIAIGVPSVIGEEVLMRGAAAQRGCFAELARGAQLDRVIYDRSGLLRFGATPSNVDLTLSRPTPGSPTPGTYASGSVAQTSNGLQFGLNTDAVFGNYATSVTVGATCLLSGADTNAPALDITGFSTQPFDATLTVTNLASAAGGTDAEDDISFLGRYRGYFPNIRRATLGAIEYGAKTVPGVAVATANEILNPSGMPAAAVELVVGDLNGNASAQMIQDVGTALLVWRAAGIPVFIQGGSVTYVAIRWRIPVLTGFDQQLAYDRVRAVTVAVSQFLPPGPDNGVLYRSALISAAKAVPGIVLNDTSLAFPLADVVPSSTTEILRVQSTGVIFE